MGAAVSLFSGAPEKGLETQQVEFPNSSVGSGVFSQPSECGFEWETQARESRDCLGSPSPPLPQNPPRSLLSARQTCDYIYFTGLGGLIVTAPSSLLGSHRPGFSSSELIFLPGVGAGGDLYSWGGGRSEF